MPTTYAANIVILMGVSGSGKTTIGQLLAAELNWPFFDADEFHPQTNIDKMRQGIPLTDQDRDSWLIIIQNHIDNLLGPHQSAVIACSALKQAYRDRLRGKNQRTVVFVYLKGDYNLIYQRMLARKSHFMPTDLLRSQFATLEEPLGALTVDISHEPHSIVEQIKHYLGVTFVTKGQ
jgi:gluconokinase